jgi:long-chain acyl-CoA synthetase
MAAQRTVADLLAALEHGGSLGEVEALPSWPRRAPARLARSLLQELVLFPWLRLVCRPWRVVNNELLRELNGQVLLIANHTSHLDGLSVLALLPPAHRRRTAVAAAADYFFKRQPVATLAPLVLGAFPFNREGAISSSLAHCGDLVDEGHSILIFPEGTRSPDGRLQPFKLGIGLLARELGLPVVPVHLSGLHAILPKGRSWPRRGSVTVTVGEPLRPDPGLTNSEATGLLEAAMRRISLPQEDGAALLPG